MVVTDRKTICFPRMGTKTIIQSGDDGFPDELQRLYQNNEAAALEALIELKVKLASLDNDAFWITVTESLSAITGAEMSFVAKRMLVDEQDAAVEMPPIGEPGSCLMATAMHYCDRNGDRHNAPKGFKYHAYACPCAYMRHDKVFIIPHGLANMLADNPNQIPFDAEAYIAVPLFAQGKCFAHFGVMWSVDGASKRQLSWPFIELLLHSLEDIILHRFLQGSNFLKPTPEVLERPQIIPHEAVTIAQSLRPYAGSLSHELRTPMQGVVGMLDVMYATVKECAETLKDEDVRKVFENLKSSIEVVQDSSRRAVEAADNVVHAYDMDMSVPDAPPFLPQDDSVMTASPAPPPDRPDIVIEGSDLPLTRPKKRRIGEALSGHSSRNGSDASSHKLPRLQPPQTNGVDEMDTNSINIESASRNPRRTTGAGVARDIVQVPQCLIEDAENGSDPNAMPAVHHVRQSVEPISPTTRIIVPGIRHTNLRDVLRWVIDEGLKLGGRPDSATARETAHGEIVEVQSFGSDGGSGLKTIQWDVEPTVPETMFIDEKDLGKLISCVFLNAIKFIDHKHSNVVIRARLSKVHSKGRYVVIKVADNGPGIPRDFLPRLFKPFSQGNSSLTRQSDGLGLGLMVAKGIARKLGGDLICSRSETEGPYRGTEFEIRVPLMAGEIVSRPSSPFGSPMPKTRKEMSRPATPTTFPTVFESSPLDKTDAANQPQSNSIPRSLGQRPRSPPSPNATDPQPQARSAAQRTSPATSSSETESNQLDVFKVRKTATQRHEIDRQLASKYPLTFLVVEDNRINRKLLVSMLNKFGYRNVHEAHDGAEAVRQMALPRSKNEQIDVILMDLWMPMMDGFEATEKILAMDPSSSSSCNHVRPTVLAVTADVTDGAVEKAAKAGMKGFMSKPYKMLDLQRLITEYGSSNWSGREQQQQQPPQAQPQSQHQQQQQQQRTQQKQPLAARASA